MNRTERRKLERKILKNGNKNSIKPNNEEMKVISFEELNLISNQNKDRFNRNINTEKVVGDIPEFKGWNMLIQPIMEHNHHLGKETEPHLRCRIHHGIGIVSKDEESTNKYDGMWIQDISFNQWESLRVLTKNQKESVQIQNKRNETNEFILIKVGNKSNLTL